MRKGERVVNDTEGTGNRCTNDLIFHWTYFDLMMCIMDGSYQISVQIHLFAIWDACIGDPHERRHDAHIPRMSVQCTHTFISKNPDRNSRFNAAINMNILMGHYMRSRIGSYRYMPQRQASEQETQFLSRKCRWMSWIAFSQRLQGKAKLATMWMCVRKCASGTMRLS